MIDLAHVFTIWDKSEKSLGLFSPAFQWARQKLSIAQSKEKPNKKKKMLEIDPPGPTHSLGKRVVRNEGTDNKIKQCTDDTIRKCTDNEIKKCTDNKRQ